MFRTPPLNKAFAWAWERRFRQLGAEGINLELARAVKQGVDVPVLCAGGFQTASVISRAIEDGSTDGVTMGRPLIANPDLPNLFAEGLDRAPKPCTYCNKCLINFVENPLGCYEESRFASRDEMIRHIVSVYEGSPLPSEVT
jgi:2,4-dienoyl-CoA reductase (NADPH2)